MLSTDVLSSVTINAITNGVKETQRLAAPAVAGNTALRSLLLVVDQAEKHASVYVNCRLQGSVNLPWTPREMADSGSAEALRAVSSLERRGNVGWSRAYPAHPSLRLNAWEAMESVCYGRPDDPGLGMAGVTFPTHRHYLSDSFCGFRLSFMLPKY
ncbi:hypothetical protein E2C01_062008 [Portunus trituberculatus]|uniref:Uncharacterized protein n=1 Tax=Portunus trituberculatus TaxID=210409 RepID=A0A5B7H9U0_PORTR|nr:hypothetical protein [Portunus trituberculatus]